MTAGWVLPRDWDAGRLLRFLTGLALLALAFAANAGLIAPPGDAAPAAPGTVATTTVGIPAAVDVPAAEPAEAPAPGQAPAAPSVITVAVIEIRISVIEPTEPAVPAGAAQGVPGSRAPPGV